MKRLTGETLVGMLLLAPGMGWCQEAKIGFDLRSTVSVGAFDSNVAAEAARDGSNWTAGFRAVLYPTLKLGDHWSMSGAVQVHSRPYFADELETKGLGLKADVLQATLNYSRFWKSGSVVLRAGVLSSTFGSFLLHYDDAENPLVRSPQTFGYDYTPITTLGLMGAEADVTFKKLDFRGQFLNSSPANRRSIFDRDQYGHWAGGAGYTIRQGLRVGFSTYYGAYLDRHAELYFPGEAPPHQLPAKAIGLDAEYAAGHWNLLGEVQRFAMSYRLIPTYHEQAAYVEIRRVLHPRWFVAQRTGYVAGSTSPTVQEFEAVVGYRPDRHQLVKIGYGVDRYLGPGGKLERMFELQLVTTVHPLSLSAN